MSHRISLRLAFATLIAAAVVPLSTRAQSQDSQSQSVADAARRAREQKKAAAKQPAPVITDDTLKPSAPPAQAANAPAQSPEAAAAKPATGSSSAPAEQPAPGSPAEDADQKAKASAELASLKEELTQAQKNLDLVLRELGLEQDNVYSKPNYASDTAGKAKLDDLKRQITDKQLTVDALKTRLAALLDSLGGTAPAAPVAPPQI
jgi:uncharacterized coiled-coil protein SlyX